MISTRVPLIIFQKKVSQNKGEHMADKRVEKLASILVGHRVVGDTLDEFHIAPRWGPDKFRVIEMIKARLAERDTRQGTKYTAGQTALERGRPALSATEKPSHVATFSLPTSSPRS